MTLTVNGQALTNTQRIGINSDLGALVLTSAQSSAGATGVVGIGSDGVLRKLDGTAVASSSGKMATISGNLGVGNTLTASPTSGWSFASGQWFRQIATSPYTISMISGATALSYVQQRADAGCYIAFSPINPTNNTVSSAVVPPWVQPIFDEPGNIADYVKNMGIGTQAGDYLEMGYAPAGLVNKPTEADMDMMAAAGITHWRIPAGCSFRASSAGVISEAFMVLMDTQINQALLRFDRVILDPLHHYLNWKGEHPYNDDNNDDNTDATPSKFFTSAQHAVRATAMWVQIANRYKNYTSRLSFDLINEPANIVDTSGLYPTGMTLADLNNWHASVIAAIRATGGGNTTRTIWMEPFGGQMQGNIVPSGVTNVGMSPHNYQPSNYAFGSTLDVATGMFTAWQAESDFYKKWAADNGNIPIWIGECGASRYQNDDSSGSGVERTGRAEFYAYFRKYILANNMPACIWAVANDFAMIDRSTSNHVWLGGIDGGLSGTLVPRDNAPPISLKGIGRRQKQYWTTPTNTLAYDAPSGTFTVTNANADGSRRFVVFPEIALVEGDHVTIRLKSYTGNFKIGVNAMYLNPTAAQDGVVGWDDQCHAPAGNTLYPPGEIPGFITYEYLVPALSSSTVPAYLGLAITNLNAGVGFSGVVDVAVKY